MKKPQCNLCNLLQVKRVVHVADLVVAAEVLVHLLEVEVIVLTGVDPVVDWVVCHATD
jgi:hypothetical protein